MVPSSPDASRPCRTSRTDRVASAARRATRPSSSATSCSTRARAHALPSSPSLSAGSRAASAAGWPGTTRSRSTSASDLPMVTSTPSRGADGAPPPLDTLPPVSTDLASSELAVNLLDGRFYAGDPGPTYRRLRDEAPLYWDAVNRVWGVSRYDDVVAVEKNVARYTSFQGSRPRIYSDESMINHDDPLHQNKR